MNRVIGCLAVFCLAALLAAMTVGCGGAHSSTLAYVSDSTGTGFTVFNVNNNGTLTPSNISPLNTTAPPSVLQITANGKWAYFLNGSQSGQCAVDSCIFGFRRTGNGTFDTAVNGSPFALTSAGSSIVVSPKKDCSTTPCFLYAAIPATKEIAIFRIDDSTGELTQVGSNKPAGATVTQLAIAPDGLALYGLAPAEQEVVGFTLDLQAGTVTNTNSPGPVGPSPANNGMILSADGNFIYVPDQVQTDLTQTQAPGITLIGQSPTIYVLSTRTNGQEGALQTVSVFNENADLVSQTFPTVPVGGATSHDNRWLFIANQNSHNISVFDIHTSGSSPNEVGGTVTQVNGQPVSTASPFDCGAACSPNFIAVSKLNNAIYVLDTFHNKIFQFAVDQNSGRLRPLSPASVDAGATPVWITIK